jgi:RNA polymerase sigma factor (sigma-70 family)
MAQRGWGGALRQMGVLLEAGTASGLTDGQLIERFSDSRSAEAAFEALVARHGPMVRQVCRQILRHEHDADDAFQAVFLVLARRAGSIRDPDLLASWLYGVSLRTARRARRRRGLKSASQPEPSDSTEAPDRTIARREEAEALHDEIGRLPENQRRAVVLCHLQGLTHEEAASRLGIPSGTVGVRLMRARERLRSCLTRRGFASSVFLFPSPIDSLAGRASVAISYLQGAASGEVPAGVASLAEGVLRTMIPLKLKFAIAFLGVGVVAIGAWSLAKAPIAASSTAVAPQTPKPAPTPARALPEAFFVIDRGTALLGPNGEEIARLDSDSNAAGAITPDGDRVAFSKFHKDGRGGGRSELLIQSRSRPEERISIPKIYGATGSSFLPLWSSDGKRILICEQGRNAEGVKGSAYRLYDLGTKDLTTLKLPDAWWPSDWSTDGKRLLTTLGIGGAPRIAWVNTDGTGEPQFITSEDQVAWGAKLSPDGRRILCKVGLKSPQGERSGEKLCVIDLDTKERTIVDEPGETAGYCWSADGERIAYTWQHPLENPAEVANRETLLITCNRDGSKRTTVTSRKYEVPPNSSGRDGMIIFFQVFDWK